MSEGKGTNAT